MSQYDEDSDNDETLEKLEEQIRQQQEIINAIKQDNANLTDEIDNIMNEKRIIEKEKQFERKKLEENLKKMETKRTDQKDELTGRRGSVESSKEDFDSIDDDSEIGTTKIPIMGERMTFMKTDNQKVNTGKNEYEEK